MADKFKSVTLVEYLNTRIQNNNNAISVYNKMIVELEVENVNLTKMLDLYKLDQTLIKTLTDQHE